MSWPSLYWDPHFEIGRPDGVDTPNSTGGATDLGERRENQALINSLRRDSFRFQMILILDLESIWWVRGQLEPCQVQPYGRV